MQWAASEARLLRGSTNMPAPGEHKPSAKTWDTGQRPAGVSVPTGISEATGRLREIISSWVAAEVAPGRLMPWLPVAFGFGIVIYFTAEREPAWWAALALALVAIVLAFLARRRAIAFPVALAFAAMALGLAAATLQTVRIGHVILQRPISSAVLAGFVEVREERERSDRMRSVSNVSRHRYDERDT